MYHLDASVIVSKRTISEYLHSYTHPASKTNMAQIFFLLNFFLAYAGKKINVEFG